MSVIHQLRGQLSELKLKRSELATAADAHMRAIKDLLAGSSIRPLEDIDADKVAYHASRLRELKAGHAEVSGKVRRIKKELGEE